MITGKNSEYSTAMGRLNGWHTTWSEVVSQVQLGNITKARARLTKLQDDDKFAPDMLAIGRMLRDRENTEMWIDLTSKIVGMVAIGLLTAGVGTMSRVAWCSAPGGARRASARSPSSRPPKR